MENKEQRIEQAVETAIERFWEHIAFSFDEIKSGDFPPDAHWELKNSCIEAVKTWVKMNYVKQYTKEELEGKFVIVYDTYADKKHCVTNDDEEPVLFDSDDEAFKEIFESNSEILQSHLDDDMLEEYSTDVTPELVETMSQISAYGDFDKMRTFMDMYPQCDYYGKWVEPAESFISPVTL